MNFKRILTIGAVGGGLAALAAGAATSGSHRPDTVLPATTPSLDASGEELAAEIARLHDRLRPEVAPQQPARNLFQFSVPKSAAVSLPAVALPPAIEAAAAVGAPDPDLNLIGIAEDVAPDGTRVRTAIISGPGQLFLVKPGDPLTDRFRVLTISAEAVELEGGLDGRPLRLTLK